MRKNRNLLTRKRSKFCKIKARDFLFKIDITKIMNQKHVIINVKVKVFAGLLSRKHIKSRGDCGCGIMVARKLPKL